MLAGRLEVLRVVVASSAELERIRPWLQFSSFLELVSVAEIDYTAAAPHSLQKVLELSIPVHS